MLTESKIKDLIHLVQHRYADWTDFTHPAFVADELEGKRAASAKAREILDRVEWDRLIAAGEFDTILTRLEQLTRGNNLLWRRVPSAGDTAILTAPLPDKATFCTQMRNLLFADRPTTERLQSFSEYLTNRELPNKWPFPTYFLFIFHPETEFFVKPQTASWFLKFMGSRDTVSGPPNGHIYGHVQQMAQAILDACHSLQAKDMVDIQSLVWVAFRESKKRIGQLNARGQIDLDVPPTRPLMPIHNPALILRETAPDYQWEEADMENEFYPLTQMATDTGYTEELLTRWRRAIDRKGQLVFYGPPGTGKTFLAEKLARHLIGGNDGFSELVQFHPAYAYEDFMQGLRPFTQPDGGLGYATKNGRFLQFCEEATRRDGICVFIIDEINRANLAAVFGELMYLLEYREQAIPLAGGGRFHIPGNIRIIGTMNTADRSIALVDHALRRRFVFVALWPNWDVLRHYHNQQATGFPVDKLIPILQRLNNEINDPHYQIGHSFFMLPDLTTHLPDIWQMEIEPYLEEYFFDQPDQVNRYRWMTIASDLT